MAIVVTAPAKLNLTLDILGRRPDGYHEIATVMQSVDLADTVTLTANDSGRLSLAVRGATLPLDNQNTAWTAAKLFLQHIGQPRVGLHVLLDKRVPMQAGMGGGSADAAGVLVGLNALTGAGLSMEELCALGARVGADVPFCIAGGTAFATGIGTTLAPYPPMPDCAIVLAKPPVGVSTGAAYAAIDSAPMLYRPDNDGMRRALEQGRLPRIGQLLCNVFEHALALPQVEQLEAAMRTFSPLGCCMTGSGSVVFALFDEDAVAARCAEALQKTDAEVFLCRPCRTGAQVVEKEKEEML